MENLFTEFLQTYDALSPEDVALIAGSLQLRRFEAGQTVLTAGNVCRKLWFVVSGSAKSFFLTEGEREYVWHFHFHRSWGKIENYFLFDYNSFLTQTPTFLTFEAIEPLAVYKADFDVVQFLLNHNPKFQKIGRRLAEDAYCAVYRKAAGLLTKPAQKRYQELMEQEPYLLDMFPNYLVAQYIGVTPQSLSRLRRNLTL